MTISIGNGVSIGAGWSLGTGSVSFTISSADINNPSNWYSGYTNATPSGFDSTGTQLYNGIRYDVTTGLYNTILAAQAAAGLVANDAWVWSANFATGGTCLVRLGLVSDTPNFVVIAPIDQTDTRWQTGSDNGPTLTGSFTFPATFTAYSPATSIYGNNSWC